MSINIVPVFFIFLNLCKNNLRNHELNFQIRVKKFEYFKCLKKLKMRQNIMKIKLYIAHFNLNICYKFQVSTCLSFIKQNKLFGKKTMLNFL